jgi:hypothetical protein
MLQRNNAPQACPATAQIEFYQSLNDILHDAGRVVRKAFRVSDQWLDAKIRPNDAGALTLP